MVLKIVRGKILETLELQWSAAACGAVLKPQTTGAVTRLLKNAIILQIISTFQYYHEWQAESRRKWIDCRLGSALGMAAVRALSRCILPPRRGRETTMKALTFLWTLLLVQFAGAQNKYTTVGTGPNASWFSV